jgi:hypothetical protein
MVPLGNPQYLRHMSLHGVPAKYINPSKSEGKVERTRQRETDRQYSRGVAESENAGKMGGGGDVIYCVGRNPA